MIEFEYRKGRYRAYIGRNIAIYRIFSRTNARSNRFETFERLVCSTGPLARRLREVAQNIHEKSLGACHD